MMNFVNRSSPLAPAILINGAQDSCASCQKINLSVFLNYSAEDKSMLRFYRVLNTFVELSLPPRPDQ